MILLMNIILLLTTYTNAGEGEDGDAGRSHKERTKELKVGKRANAVPFSASLQSSEGRYEKDE